MAKIPILGELGKIVQTNINSAVSGDTSNSEVLLALSLAASGVGLDNYETSVANNTGLPNLSSNNISSSFLMYSDESKFPVMSVSGAWTAVDGKKDLRIDNTTANPLYFSGRNSAGAFGIGCVADCCIFFWVREGSKSSWKDISMDCMGATAGIKSDGSLWSWGCGASGRLGDGFATNRSYPVREKCSATNWTKVERGMGFAIALKDDGSIWGWGCNSQGRLGNGSTTGTCSPVREKCSATNWCTMGVGFNHTGAIKTDGSLWLWGYGGPYATSKLGQGDSFFSYCSTSPRREISLGTSWCFFTGSYCSSHAIKTDGTLWGWGQNSYCEIGDGTATGKNSPVQEVSGSTNWCFLSAHLTAMTGIKTDGTLWGWGNKGTGDDYHITCLSAANINSPIQEKTSATDWWQGVQSMGGGGGRALKKNGTLWSHGANFGVGIRSLMDLTQDTQSGNTKYVQEYTKSTDWRKVQTNIYTVSGIKAKEIPNNWPSAAFYISTGMLTCINCFTKVTWEP